jgi:hypothetical protein
VDKELLELVRELKILLEPPKKVLKPLSTPSIPEKRVKIGLEDPALTPYTVPKFKEEPVKIGPKEPQKPTPKESPVLLKDLIDWFQKRFKAPVISPLNDKRAADAKERYKNGTNHAGIVLLVPKKIHEGKEFYKSLQLAIHQYLIPCMLLPLDQFSKETAQTTRLLITDPSWISTYTKDIVRNSESNTDFLWGVPIFYLEPFETLKTSEGKKRLWQALLSFPRS